jgi:hypothetical protein
LRKRTFDRALGIEGGIVGHRQASDEDGRLENLDILLTVRQEQKCAIVELLIAHKASSRRRINGAHGPGRGNGGTGVLMEDGKAVETKKIPNTVAMLFTLDETFDVGSDSGSPVDDKDYKCPFPFNGKLVKIGPSQMLPAEKKAVGKKIGERDSSKYGGSQNAAEEPSRVPFPLQ